MSHFKVTFTTPYEEFDIALSLHVQLIRRKSDNVRREITALLSHILAAAFFKVNSLLPAAVPFQHTNAMMCA